MKPDFLHAIGGILRAAFGDGIHDQRSNARLHLFAKLDERAAAEDRRFARQLTMLSPSLKGFARRLTQDDAAAEDLVQETLLRAWKARARFEMGTSMQSWTFTILKHLYISGGRRRRFIGTYDDALERSLSIDETQSTTVLLNEVQDALARLPDDQRRALHMIGVEQLSYEEAAAQVNVPTGTMKSRVARARQALVALLQDRRTEAKSVRPTRRVQSARSHAAKRTGRLTIG